MLAFIQIGYLSYSLFAQEEEKGMLPTAPETIALTALDGTKVDSEPPKKKKKGPKGPNPLSVKKKKVSETSQGRNSERSKPGHERSTKVGQKRKRDEEHDARISHPEEETRPGLEEGGGHRRRRRRKNATSEEAVT